jgi:hypothetical protein
LPPLRERPHDIVALARHFLAQRRPDMTFTAEALSALGRLDWPGNVRELRSFVNAMSMLLTHPNISADDVCCQLHSSSSLPSQHALMHGRPATVADMERELIVRALESTGGNQSLAAQQLGMPRRTLCRRLNTYNIAFGRKTNSARRSPNNCRAELHVAVALTTSNGCHDVVEACDLSTGGIGLCNVDPPIAVGEQVQLVFHLPDYPLQIDARAEVAWSRTDGSTGLKFTGLDPAATEAIQHWITGRAQPLDSVSGSIALPPDASREHVLSL